MQEINYLDLDLENLISNDIDLSDITEQDLTSFKVLITYIFSNSDDSNETTVSKKKLLKIFRRRLYDSISKERTSKEKAPKVQIKKVQESKLFRYLFTRTFLGDNLTKRVSRFKLNIPIPREELQNKSYKTFLTSIHRDSEAKLSEAEKKKLLKSKRDFKRDKNTFSNPIEIDKDFIYKELAKNNLELKDYLKLKSIVDTSKNKLNILYDIKASGRHYSQIGLLKKELRSILLNDYHEYDISTSAPNFFLEVHKQISDKNLSQIEFYINNKKAFREQLAGIILGKNFKDLSSEDKKIYYGKAKEILTMIFFGSKVKESSIDNYYNEELNELIDIKFYKTSIEDTLEKGEYSRFINSDLVKEFLSEIVELMSTVNLYLKDNYYDKDMRTLSVNNRVLTFRNKDNKLSNYNEAKALAFFYQSWENDFLLSARDTYFKNTKDSNYFLLHDALFIKKEIDIKLLENTKQSTDFIVKVTLEKE